MQLKKTFVLFLIIIFTMVSCEESDPVSVPESILTAIAGNDQQVQVGQTVKLDGSSSSDSQNKPFTFNWNFIKKPNGSTTDLVESTTAKPTFTPDIAGEYELELTVDNEKVQSKDRIIVTASAAESTTLSEFITTNTVLEDRVENPDIPDYIAPKSVVVSAQLTIKPGVTIAFAADTRFDINAEGVIVAKGDTNKKIRFTGLEQRKGFWRGMVIFSTSAGNELEHVEVSYAGSHQTLNATKAGLTLFGSGEAQVSISNCSFLQNDGYGLHAATGSRLRSFSNNIFSTNSEAGILVAADNVEKLDASSVFTSGNGRNRVDVLASSLNNVNKSEVTWTSFTDKTPYMLLGGIQVATGWKLKPGVTLEVAHDQLITIEDTGYLNAIGTATEKISITGAEQKAGFWRGIAQYSTSVKNELEYAEISYGGSYPMVSGIKANIALMGNQARLTARNSNISGSAGYGIYGRHSTKINPDVLKVNTFGSNAETDVLMEDFSIDLPSELTGKWMMGNFSMGEFWTYNGTFVGNAFDLGVAFDFKANGQMEFYFVTGGTAGSCRTEAFVYNKGTVVFNNDGSFTFTPTEGSTKGFYKGCAPSYTNYNRQYNTSELKPETYFYKLEKDNSGKDQLVIRFKKDDVDGSYFQRADW